MPDIAGLSTETMHRLRVFKAQRRLKTYSATLEYLLDSTDRLEIEVSQRQLDCEAELRATREANDKLYTQTKDLRVNA